MTNRQQPPSLSDDELLQEFKEREAEARNLINGASFFLGMPKGLVKLEAAQKEIKRALQINRELIKRGVNL
ncbi:MAG: hypothetical protein EPN14_08020 [Gallionella sp.]|nr:MAG: hypothetical protein EPN14_08020 [Gallionella sp.]